jgi:prepilin-type N-terminal cleavage/methylation domain-containing protein
MRKGFTLSEVLITLGIIGVVAALVMPGLVANYKKKVYVAQLQKAVSVFENTMKKMFADDEVDNFNDTQLANVIGDEFYFVHSKTSSPEATAILKKYFNTNTVLATMKDYYHLGNTSQGNAAMGLQLADGSVISFAYWNFGNNPTATVLIDVNGIKGPNTWGRDKFYFRMDQKGHLIPNNSSRAKELFGDTDWKEDSTICGTPGSSVIESNVDGLGCAGRIIENGLVMDY